MKIIYTLQDLEPYGVNLLTGEADRLSFRILCDLNEDGCALVSDYLGLPRDTKYADNWNSTVNGQPAIGSVMLSADTLWELARFALLTVDKFDAVIKANGLLGLNYDEPHAAWHLQQASGNQHFIYRNYAKGSSAPGVGSRNTHAMTGRTV